ncbi:16.9 kDa class I heat shock protein 2-like [Papaver somniferum]|uniref:16.9 kDa class I heat shock protein 2-like n=1 Tax=Papaver somniferum TaxID=3469 RepID=UPI000E70060D|nr:16.9 kDa class I heat shock protein 2-like [Papaver somniferum]
MSSLGPWLGGGGGGGVHDYFSSPFSSDIWDPFDWGGRRQLDASRRLGGGDDAASVIARTNVDWRETDNAHIFRADLPGLRKEEVKVQIEDGNVLQISGEHKKEEEQNETDKWLRYERRRGNFTRRFRLPENAKVDDIKCSMEHGVLTVYVPEHVSDRDKPRNVRSIDIA